MALNAYAMVEGDETRYELLVTRLNGNLDYLNNTVLARKASPKEKAGSSLRVTNIRSLDRMLANMEGIRRRRVNAGTQYLLKKRPK